MAMLEVGLEMLPAGAGPPIKQGELRGVVELPCGSLSERSVLVHDADSVEGRLRVLDGLLGGFQHRVEPPQHGDGDDSVVVVAADVDVAEHTARDAPVGDPAEVCGWWSRSFLGRWVAPVGLPVSADAERIYHDGRSFAPVGGARAGFAIPLSSLKATSCLLLSAPSLSS